MPGQKGVGGEAGGAASGAGWSRRLLSFSSEDPRPALSPPRRQDGRAGAGGRRGRGFALDKEFLRSPKGIVMGAELGLCFLVFLLLTVSVSAYMGAALLEILVTLTFLGLRATYYHERLTRVNWPCLDFLRCVSAAIIFIVVGFAVIATNHGGSAVSAFVFSLILIGIFCLDAYKTYQAEMGSEEDPERR